MGSKLEEEAKAFSTTKKKTTLPKDKTAFRFYFGSILGGLIAFRGGGRAEETVREAAALARLAVEHEKEN